MDHGRPGGRRLGAVADRHVRELPIVANQAELAFAERQMSHFAVLSGSLL